MASGQPFDDTLKDRMLRLVAEKGLHPATAGEEVGVTWATVKRHLAEDELFREALFEAQEMALARIEDKLYDEALHGNLGAIKMWLTNRAPRGRWVDERDRGAGAIGPGVQGEVVGALRELVSGAADRGSTIDSLLSTPLPVVDAEVVE